MFVCGLCILSENVAYKVVKRSGNRDPAVMIDCSIEIEFQIDKSVDPITLRVRRSSI